MERTGTTAATPAWRPPQRAVAIAAALFIAGVIFSEAVRSTFFLFFMAFLVAVILDYPVRLLSRLVRRPIAAAIVLIAILGAMFTGVRYGVPVVAEQASAVAENAPQSLDKLEGYWNRIRHEAPVDGVPTGSEMTEQVQSGLRSRATDLLSAAIPVAGMAATIVSSVILTLVLATFMVASPQSYADGVVRMVPQSHERVAREFLVRLVLTMRGWMTAQLISMTVVGALTAAGLLVLGVKGWLVLALVNFVCEFVPYIGPVVGSVPGIGVAFAGSTQTGVYALILYFLIQQIEGFVVSPLAMRHEVRLAPPLLLIWQVLMGAAFGWSALLVATPLLACVKVALDYFWVERTLGKSPAPVPGRS